MEGSFMGRWESCGAGICTGKEHALDMWATQLCLMFCLCSLFQGFCTPPEEVESDDAPQGTEFVDMEAGGFDQGQGETNVSDKVEPENIVSPCMWLHVVCMWLHGERICAVRPV